VKGQGRKRIRSGRIDYFEDILGYTAVVKAK
jgi:hypothetical protein